MSSYWFIPAAMTLTAIALSVVAVWVDHRVGDDWFDRLGWLDINKPEGARSLLATVAGSMITVAGVTFSVTITSVSLATSQFGPRLLTNFMRDRGNQIVLGTFVATFVYCLMVLRTIHDGDEAVFVPQLSVLLALAFTLASVGVFIYFIHHIASFLHASNIVAAVGGELQTAIQTPFSARIGKEPEGSLQEPCFTSEMQDNSIAIRSEESGYIQTLDETGLLKVSRDCDLVVKLVQRPGDFVLKGDVLLYAWPAEHIESDSSLSSKLQKKLILGKKRSPQQDLLFLVNELAEIATRALSTGINDPFTAMDCLDWLGVATYTFMQQPVPSSYRFDEEMHLRVVTNPIGLDEFLNSAFGQLRPYVSTDKNATLHMLKVLIVCAHKAVLHEQSERLLKHARYLADAALSNLHEYVDREELKLHYKQLIHAVYRKPVKN